MVTPEKNTLLMFLHGRTLTAAVVSCGFELGQISCLAETVEKVLHTQSDCSRPCKQNVEVQSEIFLLHPPTLLQSREIFEASHLHVLIYLWRASCILRENGRALGYLKDGTVLLVRISNRTIYCRN